MAECQCGRRPPLSSRCERAELGRHSGGVTRQPVQCTPAQVKAVVASGKKSAPPFPPPPPCLNSFARQTGRPKVPAMATAIRSPLPIWLPPPPHPLLASYPRLTGLESQEFPALTTWRWGVFLQFPRTSRVTPDSRSEAAAGERLLSVDVEGRDREEEASCVLGGRGGEAFGRGLDGARLGVEGGGLAVRAATRVSWVAVRVEPA